MVSLIFFYNFNYSIQAMTRTAPVYTVKWRSQVVRANTRQGPPTPSPNAVSSACFFFVYNSRCLLVELFSCIIISINQIRYLNRIG